MDGGDLSFTFRVAISVSFFRFFFWWTCRPLAVGIELAKPRLKYHDTPTYCVTSRTERDSYRFFPPSPRQSIEQPLVIVASRPRLVRTLMSSPDAGADPVVPSRCGAGRLPCAGAGVLEPLVVAVRCARLGADGRPAVWGRGVGLVTVPGLRSAAGD